MTIEDQTKIKLYKKFQEAYELGGYSSKVFNFKFGSLEYWSLANGYIDYMINKENNFFMYYHSKLSDDVKRVLS